MGCVFLLCVEHEELVQENEGNKLAIAQLSESKVCVWGGRGGGCGQGHARVCVCVLSCLD